ncbi:DNA repair protein XRCC2-like [Calliphora vicina]|uniref:DNA repair protein XRCC2-like n=1 Tax=Calliphora vicina TaxID=7373 RepID=UPI00325AD760
MILSGYQFKIKSIATQRPALKNIWNEVFPANGPQAKSLVEISGAPGTGKRILLYELMARATLSTCFGGKDSQVIFVDLCHKFDASSFTEYVKNVMNKNVSATSHRSLENSVKYPCESIIHLPCYLPDQFEFAFKDIEELLCDHKRVSLVAIDGLDTFYWDDCNTQLQRMTTHYKKLIQRLKPICQEHNICCAYTVDANYLLPKSKRSAYFPHSQIDYKLKLVKHIDGRRYLNDSPIEINCNGIEFLTNKCVI